MFPVGVYPLTLVLWRHSRARAKETPINLPN